MKRIVTAVAALGLAITACGGGDGDADTTASAEVSADADATAPEGAGTEEPAEAAPAQSAESTDSDGASDDGESGDGESGDDDTAESGEADDGDDSSGDAAGSDADDGGSIRSISDVPEACRDEMARFLRDIEPIVSPIDWTTATFAEFEAIFAEFETLSDEYDRNSSAAGCDDLDFVEDAEFDLMIDFARDEAPGTVGFLEFLASVGAATGTDGAGDDTGSAGFASCDEAVTFVQDLLDEYDSFTEVPAAELVKFSSLPNVYVTCSPEQLEFFDSPEVNAFLSGE